jgi:protein-(glutamine-N5) methyltransferase, release factor-specific
MIKISEIYSKTKKELSFGGVEFPAEEASLLIGHFTGISRTELLTHPEKPISDETVNAFSKAVSDRISGRPLQYILGNWDFMSLRLFVGEGVLIPREDTIVLVETAARLIRESDEPLVQGVDLCAGTGAVGLGIASLLPNINITAIELSDKAYPYLLKNCNAYADFKVNPVQGDILDSNLPKKLFYEPVDFIVSNPPYIAEEEISGLQKEVQREPKMALWGGEDGYDFYHGIAEIWIPKLREKGFIAVEIGETQAEKVEEIFEEAGIKDIKCCRDLGGLPRAISGRKVSVK